MFGQRRRQRQRGTTFMFLDAMERGRWEGRQEGIPCFEGREAAQATVGNIASLLDVCGGEAGRVMELVEEWAEERQAEFDERGDEERRTHVASVGLWLGLNGAGNLFGLIPEDAPSYDPPSSRRRAGREAGSASPLARSSVVNPPLLQRLADVVGDLGGADADTETPDRGTVDVSIAHGERLDGEQPHPSCPTIRCSSRIAGSLADAFR